jgi:hypothetical protein
MKIVAAYARIVLVRVLPVLQQTFARLAKHPIICGKIFAMSNAQMLTMETQTP